MSPEIGIHCKNESEVKVLTFYCNIWPNLIVAVCYYHVTYAFKSESTLYSWLNVKELIAWNRRKIWSLSDSNGIQTQNHLVRKRTLNHLAKRYIVAWCNKSPHLYMEFKFVLNILSVRLILFHIVSTQFSSEWIIILMSTWVNLTKWFYNKVIPFDLSVIVFLQSHFKKL